MCEERMRVQSILPSCANTSWSNCKPLLPSSPPPASLPASACACQCDFDLRNEADGIVVARERRQRSDLRPAGTLRVGANETGWPRKSASTMSQYITEKALTRASMGHKRTSLESSPPLPDQPHKATDQFGGGVPTARKIKNKNTAQRAGSEESLKFSAATV